MLKIKQITVINNNGIDEFKVGIKMYGSLLDRIENNTKEYENSIDFIYSGYDKYNELMFELINLPVKVIYE